METITAIETVDGQYGFLYGESKDLDTDGIHKIKVVSLEKSKVDELANCTIDRMNEILFSIING